MQIIQRTKFLFQRLQNLLGSRFLWTTIFLSAILLLLAVLFPASTGWLENYLYDLRHSIAAPMRAPNASLAVVGIDMKTLAASSKRWPWPRQDVASCLRIIGRLKPRGIIVDILFQNADTEEGDSELESAIKEQENLILISILEEKSSNQGVSLARFTSLPRFSDNAMSEGFVWGVIDRDGKLRSFKISDDRLNARSTAMLALESFYQADKEKLSRLPSSAPVVFARKHGGIPVISMRDIMENEDRFKDFCRDKVLILGVNAQAVHDFHNTPMGIVAGAEILAASLDTLVSERIGKVLFNSTFYRAASCFTGAVLSWSTIMSSLPLLVGPLIFISSTLLLMTFCECFLFHLPIVPMIAGWLVVYTLLYAFRYFDTLFSLKEMQREAENASVVQEQLLPSEKLVFKDYQIFGVSRSASELGGDYFDYQVVDNRYLLVFIGDATGHGVAAALAMAIGKATFMMSLQQKLLPEQLIEAINSVLFSSLRRKLMMTAAILWLDTQTDEFDYYNCGHTYPYLLKQNGEITQLSASGLFLGTKATYKTGKPFNSSFDKGDKLLFYTDGLIESISVDHEKDSFRIFQDYLKSRPALRIKDACRDIIDNHPFFSTGQPQPDDFTVLMVERLMN